MPMREGFPYSLLCMNVSILIEFILEISSTHPPPHTPPSPRHACRNSEIYNFRQVVAEQLPGVHIPSQSDSAIIGYLVQAHGDTNELWNSLDGIFACVVWDEATCEFTIARDPLGICSLYWGKDKDGSIWAASEMKALQHLETLDIFPPVS